ncbi:MAG TPA: peptidoglycan-associated lipoprotein Pal [Terriglobales bacterium]|nr:peptidoglycan-associated lipoprotein Pal [Terriglobales bacterium]
MKQSRIKWIAIVAALAVLMVLAGCKKKPPPPPPAIPPPPQPTASLTANPNSIQQGESTTLTWQTTNASDVTLESIGAVQANGSQQVTPTQSTTYRLIAKGAGGTQEATARVTVAQPPPSPPMTTTLSDEQLFNQNVKDAFFDYDKSDIRPDAQQALMADAAFLQQHPNIRFTVEGHCDERGSTEYNLGLGDRRATAVKSFLVQQGVSADRIRTISYGKEKPFCTEHTEDCWQQNRRGHFVYQR